MGLIEINHLRASTGKRGYSRKGAFWLKFPVRNAVFCPGCARGRQTQIRQFCASHLIRIAFSLREPFWLRVFIILLLRHFISTEGRWSMVQDGSARCHKSRDFRGLNSNSIFNEQQCCITTRNP
jgi:hypothetical protein